MTDLIGKYSAHQRQQGLAENTIESREGVLRRLDAELPMGLEEATVEELTNWLARRGWQRRTRARYTSDVVCFYEWACDPAHPHLDWNPAAVLARPKVPRGVPKPVSDDEVRAAIAGGGVWRKAIVLMAYAGMRCIEVANGEREDIAEDWTNIRGKGDHERAVPTFPQVWGEFRNAPPGPFYGLDAGQISRGLQHHFDRVGMPRVTAHRLRHWYGTTLVGGGANLKTVAQLMGHAHTSTTEIYVEITDGQRRSAVATLPVLFAPASS